MKPSMSSFDADREPLPGWMIEALRAPATSRADSRARIMQQVGALPVPRRVALPLSAAGRSRWRRRGALSGIGSVLLTAMLTLMVSVRSGSEAALAARVQPSAIVLGDSTVPVRGPDSLALVLRGKFLDTLYVVEYVVHGRGVQSVSVRREAARPRDLAAPARLARVSATEWRTRALVPREAREVAFVVNDIELAPVRLRAL
ncbi:MAG: hypothetical protein K2Y26_14425 [Gemmatimonadaceae bacterium]|nr:hypothetical protein [Gemmatimonadaceae bacterium]